LTKINNIKNFSLLLVLSAVITVTLTTPTDSFAVVTSGDVTGGSSFTAGGIFDLVTIPIPGPNGFCLPNSVGDNCQQTHDLWAFDEDQNIDLSAPLTVDDSTGDGIPNGAILPIGTMVASHYVYYDPQPRSSKIVGCVQFDSPVVATIFSTSRLAASDFLANTGVTYLNPNARGFEGPDIATFSGSEVCVSLRAGSPGDYFRVLTEFSPGGNGDLDIDIDKCVSFNKDDFEESNIRCADEASARSIIVLEGETVFFRIDATRSNEDATGVVVNDLLPNGLEFVSSKDLLTATGGYVSATGIWTVGEISEGGTRSLLIEATVATGTCGKTLVNTAILTAVVEDEGPSGNNQDSASVEVELTAQEEECPSKSSGAGGHEPPTIGMNMAGNQQIVTNGMGIDGQFRTVTQQFHEEMELIQMLTSPHTISNTIFCNEGVQECDYVGIAFTTKDFDYNDPVMKVEAQKTGGEWIISWYDPQDFIQDPDDAIPGEITFTAQIDGDFLLTSFTINFKNKDTGQLVIGIQVRDEERGVRTFWFNEGVEFKDSDAYPSIETEFENPLEIDSLCLNEDPTYRYSCAFAKKVQLEIERAEKLLKE